MTPHSPTRSSVGSRAPRAAFLVLGLALAAGCGGGGGGGESTGGPVGTQVSAGFTYPSGIDGSPAGFFVDPNSGGSADALKLVGVRWGRLVDVYDFNSSTGARELQQRDFVIGEEIATDGLDFQLETNPVTGASLLIILHQKGTSDYAASFASLTTQVGEVLPKGVSPAELPPFSFVPRNGAIVLIFNDLIDHETIASDTLRVFTGPVTGAEAFESRLVPDPNYGGLVDGPSGPEFRTTRILIDTTVSELEASGTSLEVNSLGLPPSINTSQANVTVRIPTQLSFSTGQFELLRSVSGEPVTYIANGPIDLGSPTKDVVRTMRSGGEPSLTGDSNNGFLLDLNPPRLVGTQSIQILAITPLAGDKLSVNLQFEAISCALAPLQGDVIQQPGLFAEVVQPATPPALGLVNGVIVRVLDESTSSMQVGQGTFSSTFLSTTSSGAHPCFVSFSPQPAAPPSTKVAPTSLIVARFSEPMDPASITPFDTFFVTRTQPPSASSSTIIPLDDFVIAEVLPSTDLTEFRVVPVLPFAHTQASEDYFVTLKGGTKGVTDLAGNPVNVANLPSVKFTIDPLAPAVSNGGLVLRFSTPNEDGDAGGKPEIRGQFLFDAELGLIRPRPVTRFTGVADRTQAMITPMTPIATGVQTPLAPLGSKLMSVYRYPDVGFSSTDEANFNVDIERLYWSPLNGAAVSDFYEQFQMKLTHSRKLPDEFRNPASLLPDYPNSGLEKTSFDINVLQDPLNQFVVVHAKDNGYLVNALDMIESTTGTPMLAWPMNHHDDTASYVHYTWRDTSIQAMAAPDGEGIDLKQMEVVGLIPPDSAGQIARDGQVPSIGLPLLMEFRCYPTVALGLNSFDISIATNSSARPNFRVFSTGGKNAAGDDVQKDPDLETVPDGGFNQSTASGLGIGAPTDPGDNSFYIGQMDLVYRVSRVHTIWFDSKTTAPDYVDPVLEPDPGSLPGGTDVVVAFRGATLINPVSSPALVDAGVIDPYGDQPCNLCDLVLTTPATYYAAYYPGSGAKGTFKNPTITFKLNGSVEDFTWKDDIDQIDGTRYFQMRFTFISNVVTEQEPELSAIGVAFVKP